MTKQTWTVFVSALLFLIFTVLVLVLPAPYVTWRPGATYDLLAAGTDDNPVQIGGVELYPTTGELRMTTVSVTSATSQLSLPEVVVSYWIPDREVLPRESIYPAGVTYEQVTSQESQQMLSSQSNAAVAGLRAAGIAVHEFPMVLSVLPSGPSLDLLQVGDLIMQIDGIDTVDPQGVSDAMSKHHPGDSVVVTFLRGKVSMKKTIVTKASNKQPEVPILGISLGVGYSYGPDLRFGVASEVGGSSGGLAFAMAIYDKLTPDDLINSRIVAATGTINSQGEVGAIGGVREKIAAAKRDNAEIFLLPEANCKDVKATTGIKLIPVNTLNEAINALVLTQDESYVPKGC